VSGFILPASCMRLEIVALSTLPEVRPGDDLASLIREAAADIDQSVIVSSPKRCFEKRGSYHRSARDSAFSLGRSWAPSGTRMRPDRTDPGPIAPHREDGSRRHHLGNASMVSFVPSAGVDQSNVQATISQPSCPSIRRFGAPASHEPRMRRGDRHGYLRPSMARRPGGRGHWLGGPGCLGRSSRTSGPSRPQARQHPSSRSADQLAAAAGL